MGTPLFQVDAFADRPYAGNPAAVCVLEEDADGRWMAAVAAEMNLSETAFLRPTGSPDRWGLRWFTPTVEVDLCGHATLASAHVLWQAGRAPRGRPLRFETRSGELSAESGGEGWIALDFPRVDPRPESAPRELFAALGAPARSAVRAGEDWLVELEDEAAVRALTPDLPRLATVPARGVCVTARADGTDYDFVSRFFGPRVGVDEDPVTGSSHCALAPYWAPRTGKDAMLGYQASARGGTVRVQLAGERVVLEGRAVTVLRGELLDGSPESRA